MKLPYIALIVLFVISIAVYSLSVFGIQTVSSDKDAYSIGENVQIQWLDIRVDWHTCSGKGLEIFENEAGQWKHIAPSLSVFGMACLNGTLVSGGYGCDLSMPILPHPSVNTGAFNWSGQVYTRTGTVDSCLIKGVFEQRIVNRTMPNYELKNAESGKYKIKYGRAEKIIEIR